MELVSIRTRSRPGHRADPELNGISGHSSAGRPCNHTSGANKSAQISIIDLNLIGLGNDFALDDLGFALNEIVPTTAAIFVAVEIDWNSQSGATYQVQYSDTADSGVWINLSAPVAGTGEAMAVFDSTRSNPERIYRIVALP